MLAVAQQGPLPAAAHPHTTQEPQTANQPPMVNPQYKLAYSHPSHPPAALEQAVVPTSTPAQFAVAELRGTELGSALESDMAALAQVIAAVPGSREILERIGRKVAVLHDLSATAGAQCQGYKKQETLFKQREAQLRQRIALLERGVGNTDVVRRQMAETDVAQLA